MEKMNRHKFLIQVLIWTIFIGSTACLNNKGEKSLTDKSIDDSSSPASQPTNSAVTDSLNQQIDKLKNYYTQAIAEFIKAAYNKDKTTFDTLYFIKHVYGQPDDFPDIDLPETIEKTQIRLIDPEVGQKMGAERKSLVYVNMMGWIDNDKAEFIFVIFKNGGEHQYDYYINFDIKPLTNYLELDKIEFENYLHLEKQKPKRITIYADGKYVGDK